MSKSLCYLSGPLWGCSAFEAKAWRSEAKLLLGAENCIDPAETWVPAEDALSLSEQRKLVDCDLAAIDRCRGFLYCCWRPSYGSPMELFYANRQRKLTATVATGPVSAWVAVHSDFIGQTVAESARWLAVQLRIECPLLRRDQ